MNSRNLLIGLVVCFGLLEVANIKRTGFKARITSNGLNYANKAAMDALAAKIRTFNVPDQHWESSGFKDDLTNLRVTGFTEPQSSIVFLPEAGLKWTANGAGVSMNGNFRYKFHMKWTPTIRGHGSLDISFSGIDFSINMIFGVDLNGRPTIAASGCSCGISDICDSLTRQINEDGEKKLASLPVTTKLGNHFLLDYRLLQTPNFQSSYMETFHKGEIFWLGDETDAPFDSPMMEDFGDTKKMIYLWISDYMFNTLGHAAQMHDYLVHKITAADLPPYLREILNTTCTSFTECLGILISQLPVDFLPNSFLELNLFSGSYPTMTITPEEVKVSCGGKIVLCARRKDNSLGYLMSIIATMETTVNVSIANELVYGKIYDMKLVLNETNPAVGSLFHGFIQMHINDVLKPYLIAKINELGQKGFPLPVTGKIRFVNTSLRLLQHAIVIETDLNYTG